MSVLRDSLYLSDEHPIVTYTAEGYDVWLGAVAKRMLTAAGLLKLLAVVEAAQRAVDSDLFYGRTDLKAALEALHD